jgi:hypothetical protein
LHELGGKKLILNPETLENFEHMTSTISKGCICQTLCWELLDDIFLKKNLNINISKNNTTKKY